MSQENVEVVRRVLDAYERRDFATVFAAYAPKTEWQIEGLMAEAMGSRQIGDFDPVYYWHDGIAMKEPIDGLDEAQSKSC